MSAPDRSAAAATAQMGRGASLLSGAFLGVGVLTFGYFSLASHALDGADYKRIVLLWSLTFLMISVIYRPIEQLIARTVGLRRSLGVAGEQGAEALRAPLAIQAGFAVVFLAASLVFRDRIENDVFDGSSTLFWVLVGSVLAFGLGFAARGWLAGHGRFGLYGGLIVLEAASRVIFPVLVLAGVAGGQSLIALGLLSAPAVSLVVVPWALARRSRGAAVPAAAAPAVEAPVVEAARGGLLEGTTFAAGAFGVLLAEQALLNGGILIVDAKTSDEALAGFVFNAMLIARAPLVLFMAVQASLLPHLSGLNTAEGRDSFAHAVRSTITLAAGFAAAAAVGLLLIGPAFMDAFFADDFTYARGGLALVAVGVGFHLVASTLTQAALARGRARRAGVTWLIAASAFIAWMLLSDTADLLLRVQIGYAASAALLAALAFVLEGLPRDYS